MTPWESIYRFFCSYFIRKDPWVRGEEAKFSWRSQQQRYTSRRKRKAFETGIKLRFVAKSGVSEQLHKRIWNSASVFLCVGERWQRRNPVYWKKVCVVRQWTNNLITFVCLCNTGFERTLSGLCLTNIHTTVHDDMLEKSVIHVWINGSICECNWAFALYWLEFNHRYQVSPLCIWCLGHKRHDFNF
jgi:hypothetical protein